MDKLRLVEEIVKIPRYFVVGYTHGKLVYGAAEETVNLRLLDLASGSRRKLAENVYGVANITPKSPLIVFTRDVGKGREQHRVYITDVEKCMERAVPYIEPRRITGMCFDGETIALSAASKEAVELWTVKPDGSAERIYKTANRLFASSVDRNRIVGFGTLKGDPKASELFIYELNSGEFKVYTPREGSTNRSPKLHGDRVLFTTTAFGGEELLVYRLEEGELEKPRFTHKDYEKFMFTGYLAFNWFGDGKIWFIGKRDGRTKAFVDGKLLPLPKGFTSGLTVVDESRVYVTWSSLTSPNRIYEVDLNKGEVKVLMRTKLSEAVKTRLGGVKFFKYRSFDGLEIPSFLVESTAASKPGPTVVYVHGGPWSEVVDRWSVLIASLVVCGYYVVAPNFRGSTGYGEKFRRMNIGDPGGGDLMDVAYAARWARETGLSSKIAIMGYSYGGFMTFLATVKQPSLWDAGVAGAGIVDWAEMYELGDALFKRFIDILFDGKRGLWKDRSASYFAENLKAPLCIIHPQNDTRTPLKPVLKYVLKLLELGKTFELHVLPDTGHLVTRLEDAIKLLFPTAIFLEKHLTR